MMFGGHDDKNSSLTGQSDEKKESIRKRKYVNRLYFEYDISKREIARKEDVSREFVKAWTQSPDQDFTMDNRGRDKGDRVKWEPEVVRGLIEVRSQLEEDPAEPYWGPSAVHVEYRKAYPQREAPPIRTIGKILKDMGMTDHQQKGVTKGALRYLRYPEYTIYNQLGERIIEADFVGDKFIEGRSEPLHFLGFSAKKEPRMRYFERVRAETAEELITYTKAFFDRFEVPDVLKVDNGSAMTGGGAHKRLLSRTVRFLLERKVIPVFSVPRRPATQASIEGSNSVFSRKFWERNEFGSLQEVDEKLSTFNKKSLAFLQYTSPENSLPDPERFEPKVFYTRQVREQEKGDEGHITVANESLEVPAEYIKRFVLAEWKLREEKLLLRMEEKRDSKEEEPVGTEVIEEIDFPIHESSKEKSEEILR
jgi:hypothetical protein